MTDVGNSDPFKPPDYVELRVEKGQSNKQSTYFMERIRKKIVRKPKKRKVLQIKCNHHNYTLFPRIQTVYTATVRMKG